MNEVHKPEARKDGLVIQDLPEEILVYDLNTNKAHCLNQTAAYVWQVCDGNNSVTDITKLFAKQFGGQINEDFVWLAIDQLNEKELLQTGITSGFKGETRRSVIKKIGLATVIALPVVASLAAPTSVLAVGSCANCTFGVACPSSCPPFCPSNGAACTAPPIIGPIKIEKK